MIVVLLIAVRSHLNFVILQWHGVLDTPISDLVRTVRYLIWRPLRWVRKIVLTGTVLKVTRSRLLFCRIFSLITIVFWFGWKNVLFAVVLLYHAAMHIAVAHSLKIARYEISQNEQNNIIKAIPNKIKILCLFSEILCERTLRTL